ncbi:MAG: hypothetical protein ACLP19_18160 [Xanthobacteraceae bacterium]
MEETSKGAPDNRLNRPPEEFPPNTFPTVFADGVASYAKGAGFVKFYLYRIDPNMFGRGGSVANPFAQVVMGTYGFAQAFVLFERAMEELIKEGQITDEQMKTLRKDLVEVNTPKGASA